MCESLSGLKMVNGKQVLVRVVTVKPSKIHSLGIYCMLKVKKGELLGAMRYSKHHSCIQSP